MRSDHLGGSNLGNLQVTWTVFKLERRYLKGFHNERLPFNALELL